ncbi:unnamed protein product [Miscanthus lutarioriparius]|uniref:25S rRNA (uridine-N(3))-methyltransferase BMT5-like domain-containing protein n=1 Tax=Miscanthus lutarioriparius TaxID=422564 RepID=A0A811NLP8_9POAL|nr:unnamed protein product [Miscanthus lutarioriparius]
MEKPTAGEERVKRVKHYSSAQSILLVGDGDFSFSLALATAFGSGANLVATSLDTYCCLPSFLWPFFFFFAFWVVTHFYRIHGALTIKYRNAGSNIMELKRFGARVLHGVDVETMKLHNDLKNRRFDRVVFNFPHAGFRGGECEVHMINSHKELVSGFFSNARHLLGRYGEIHVSHETGHPYDAGPVLSTF